MHLLQPYSLGDTKNYILSFNGIFRLYINIYLYSLNGLSRFRAVAYTNNREYKETLFDGERGEGLDWWQQMLIAPENLAMELLL